GRRGRGAAQPLRRGRGRRRGRLGARLAVAGAARAAAVPRRLRGPVPDLRREPQRGARPRPRARAGPALGQAARAEALTHAGNEAAAPRRAAAWYIPAL